MTTRTLIGLLATGAILATVAVAQVRSDRNPAGTGDRAGTEFQVPPGEQQQPARQQPLRVDSLQVQRIAGASDLGAAGDLLITFHGQGFALTSLAPRLIISGDLALESTEINRDGTELYVVLPRNLMSRIEAMRFDSVTVANPGARQDTEFARASVRATSARLLRPDPTAPAVRVLYRDGAFSREPAGP
ncbi:MAG TPA: hypothetical protein VK912_01025 [Longimicrobiales bacterium]|nr:hypothetical protein [Longimicrobiales bacterium]